LSSFVRSTSSTLSIARLAVTLFALLAFTLQSYAMQVHVHGARIAALQKPEGTQKPSDTAHCPICQEILHFGHYVTPSASTILPGLLVVPFAASFAERIGGNSLPSRGWNSRAPPSA